MKKICTMILSISIALSCAVIPSARKVHAKESVKALPKNVIRVATYNIAANRYDQTSGIQRMNTLLKEKNIDIVGLQEVDQFTGRNNYDMLQKFIDQGYFKYKYFQKAIDFSGGQYGIGTLSTMKPIEITGGLLYSDGVEGRAYQRTLIEKAGKQIAVYNTHLAYESIEIREKQLREVLEQMDNDPCKYKILTGDFNVDQLRQEVYPMLENYNISNGYNKQWFDTYRLKDDTMKIYSIDNIVFTRNMKLNEVNVINDDVSDHKMLYAELEFLEEEIPSRQYLDMVVDEANAIREDSYTEESYIKLQESLNLVKKLESKAGQNQIDNVRKAVQLAMDGLEEREEPVKDPIVYYNFEGNVDDQIGNYNGNMVDSPVFTDKGYGGSKALQTGIGYVQISDLKLEKKDFTISYWFKSDEEKNDTLFFGNKTGDSGKEAGIFISNYAGLFANVGTGNNRYDTAADAQRDQVSLDGEWHYITVVADRDHALTLYVDGKLSSSNTNFADISDMSMDTEYAYTIGSGSHGGYRTKAKIDEFKIYDLALTNQQVKRMYSAYFIDKSELETIYNQYKDLDEMNYIKETWNIFQMALVNAKSTLEDENVTQEEINKAIENLQNSFKELRYKTADYSKVDEAIQKAEALNKEDYKDFSKVEAAIQAVVRNQDITKQSEVDAMAKAIEKAIAELDKKEVVNKDELKEAIAKKPAKEEKAYTSESWKTYQEALEHAKEVNANKNATQEEVNEAKEALLNAMQNLKENPDLTPLEPSKPIIPLTPIEPSSQVIPMTPLKPATSKDTTEKPNTIDQEENEEKPNTGVSTNTALLWSILLGTGIMAISLFSKKRKIYRN